VADLTATTATMTSGFDVRWIIIAGVFKPAVGCPAPRVRHRVISD
jgi:hypothetical protein